MYVYALVSSWLQWSFTMLFSSRPMPQQYGFLVSSVFMSIILTSALELRWSGIGIEDWWRNEQFWVIGGVSAHLFAVFQGILKKVAGLDTNFTVTAKSSDDGEFGELYLFKWTTVLIPPTSILLLNLVGCVLPGSRMRSTAATSRGARSLARCSSPCG
jgi:hypothetical protein